MMRNFLRILTITGSVLYLSLLVFLPSIDLSGEGQDNYFEVSLNGRTIGLTDSEETAYNCLKKARRNAAFGSDHLPFAEA